MAESTASQYCQLGRKQGVRLPELWEVRTAGTLFPSEAAFAGRGQEPACRLHLAPPALLPAVGSEMPRLAEQPCLPDTPVTSVLVPPTLLLGVTEGRALSYMAASRAAGHLRGPEKI